MRDHSGVRVYPMSLQRKPLFSRQVTQRVLASQVQNRLYIENVGSNDT